MTGTQEIQWGPAIAVDGKRPGFVRAEDVCAIRQSNPKDWLGLDGRVKAWVWGWGPIKQCKLPADHPHYRQTEAAQPTPQVSIKPDVTARMEALVREVDEHGPHAFITKYMAEEARAIVALLPEPVDPDEELAHDMATKQTFWNSQDLHANAVALALSAIKRGRELALAGETGK